MRRGDVYVARLVPRSGSEQTGTRPVIIVSDDVFNTKSAWRSIIVVPVSSSSKQAARGPTAVQLPAGTGGLTTDSVAICHQITTLDRSKLTKRLGGLPTSFVRDVEAGIKTALDMS